ncbi:MAG: phage head closure protein [Ahrensia sp.]|nr:phage head closure protein [Ahrensia sp.]
MRSAPHNGELRHRVTVKHIVRQPDGAGGFVRLDDTLLSISARVKTFGASEGRAYMNLQERVSHRIVIRYRDDITQGQSAIWHHPKGDVDLYILSAIDHRPERPGEWMALLCREGGNT